MQKPFPQTQVILADCLQKGVYIMKNKWFTEGTHWGVKLIIILTFPFSMLGPPGSLLEVLIVLLLLYFYLS